MNDFASVITKLPHDQFFTHSHGIILVPGGTSVKVYYHFSGVDDQDYCNIKVFLINKIKRERKEFDLDIKGFSFSAVLSKRECVDWGL